MIFVLAIIVIIVATQAYKIIQYNKTSYKEVTHNSYFRTIFDKGRHGEYDIYRYLKDYEARGCKFLFNVYLPKKDGKTTEIDAMMIAEEAIYVFESKNYSGWIFGNDTQKTWTQVLPKGKGKSQKERFYNPVWQNKTHCEALKTLLPQNTVIKSIILFSNRCTFKDLTITRKDVTVGHRRDVRRVVENMARDGQKCSINVNQIYEKLYPFSQVSAEIKQAHIDDINSYMQ